MNDSSQPSSPVGMIVDDLSRGMYTARDGRKIAMYLSNGMTNPTFVVAFQADEEAKADALLDEQARARKAIAASLMPPPEELRRRTDGRRLLIGLIDNLLAQPCTIRKIADAMQAELNADPLGFAEKYGLKLTPTDMLVQEAAKESSQDAAANLRQALAASVAASNGVEVSEVTMKFTKDSPPPSPTPPAQS